MNTHPMSRRAVLKAAGGAALATPLLGSFAQNAYAQQAAPQRLVVVMNNQGNMMDSWVPAQIGRLGALGPTLAPIDQLRDKITLVSGVNNEAGLLCEVSDGHERGRTTLIADVFAENMNHRGEIVSRDRMVPNGSFKTPSFEQVLGRHLRQPHQYTSLNLGIGTSSRTEFHESGNGASIIPHMDPQRVANKVFLDGQQAAQESSVLDTIMGGFRHLRTRLGARERRQLDAHAEKIRDMELRLGRALPYGVNSCGHPNLNLSPNAWRGQGGQFDWRIDQDVAATAMVDITAMAFACDTTRVVNLWFEDAHGIGFDWLGDAVQSHEHQGWHEMVHSNTNPHIRSNLEAGFAWYAQVVANLIRRLESIPEGNGTMLDNTLILWISEFGDGGAHDVRNLPVLLAGGVGGLRHGQHLRAEGKTTGDLYTSIFRLFGDRQRPYFGRPELCSGGIPELA